MDTLQTLLINLARFFAAGLFGALYILSCFGWLGNSINPTQFSKMKIIKDKRALRALERAGHIKMQAGHSYVDETESGSEFSHRGKKYRLRYFDGCFFPFVIQMSNINSQK